MNVLSIFRIKKILRAYTFRECKELTDAAMHLSTPDEIEDLVRTSLREKFPEEFRENFGFKISDSSPD
jgi:phosphoenolpyruvate-protein kinase (PTS system EI component)